LENIPLAVVSSRFIIRLILRMERTPVQLSGMFLHSGDITWVCGLAEMVEHLPSRCEALSSNSSITKINK
jgi:hypothetical protein